MVLQAVADDKQLFVSLPVTPFTYHLVLATIVKGRVKNSAESNKVLIVIFSFINFSSCWGLVAHCEPRTKWTASIARAASNS
jgi:hypothetical protein